MAAANFSRDVLENNQTDLIDFETIIENPKTDFFDWPQVKKAPRVIDITNLFEKYLEQTQGIPLFLREKKLYNHCEWLKIGKKKDAESVANNFIVELTANISIKEEKSNQLRKCCEKKYGVGYK